MYLPETNLKYVLNYHHRYGQRFLLLRNGVPSQFDRQRIDGYSIAFPLFYQRIFSVDPGMTEMTVLRT